MSQSNSITMSPATSPKMEDVGFIMLMGMTGSGKSTFISRLTGQQPQEPEIGHGLASKTVDINCYTAQYDQTRIIRLIDTPGFDDTTRSDAEILRSIASHLATLHRARQHLLGIVCLQRITDVRLSGSAIRNFTILKKLCGPENYHRVVLATTMWSHVAALNNNEQKEAALVREDRLAKYWHDLFQGRSALVPHVDIEESEEEFARRTLGFLINSGQSTSSASSYYQPLQIQHEMVDSSIALEDTEAGRYVRGEIRSANRARLDREIAQLEEAVNKARREADEALSRSGVNAGRAPSNSTSQLALQRQQRQQGEDGEPRDTWSQNILPRLVTIRVLGLHLWSPLPRANTSRRAARYNPYRYNGSNRHLRHRAGSTTSIVREFFGSMFSASNNNGTSGVSGNNRQNVAPLTSSSTSDLGY